MKTVRVFVPQDLRRRVAGRYFEPLDRSKGYWLDVTSWHDRKPRYRWVWPQLVIFCNYEVWR